MTKFVPRSITFTIPAKLGLGVQVTVVENEGNLDFTVEVLGARVAGLQGLFLHLLDEADLSSLKILGGDGLITKTQIKADGVIDLGQGNDLKGAASPFDVGIAFGKGADLITGPVHFTLDAAQDLTLDDISHVMFGARLTNADKLTFLAPAAPDAKDDTATTHEDTSIVIPVLTNDSDADGNKLTITSVELKFGVNGTVQIATDGKSIIYNPDFTPRGFFLPGEKDYAGTNVDPHSADATFMYSVSDGHGGQDSATVSVHVIPVADKPTITLEVLAPEANDPVNMVRLKVSATQTDADGSEFIDHFGFVTPPGSTLITDGSLSTTGQPHSATEYVQLLLPTNQDVNFDLTATAYAQEKGNGDPDEASASTVQHIAIDFNHNESQQTFLAQNQSIWGGGPAFSIDNNLFLGPNVSLDADFGVAATQGHFKAGLTADIHIQGGAINAHIPFDITIDTTYNKTTDTLLIHTGATLASGGGFTTTGPEGNFSLGALLDFALTVLLVDPTGISDPTTLFSFSTPSNVLSGSLAAFSSTSPDLPISLDVPFGSIALDWPHLSTTSTTPSGSTISGSGTSNNFVNLTADLDYMASYFFPIFQPVEAFIGPDITDPDPESTFQWLDLDASIGANLLQNFLLKVLGLGGTLKFENNTTQQIVLGNDIVIKHASSLEGSDLNKTIDFALSLLPNVTLDNTTSIGFNSSGTLYIAKNAVLFDPITVPLFSTPIATVPIDDGGAFTLNFNTQSYDFFV
jgi:hypothetical protein